MKTRNGEVYFTNENYRIEIVDYRGSQDIDIRFDDGRIINTDIGCITRGTVKNKMHKSVAGIGYIGDGEYKTKINGVRQKQYTLWTNMINRCYDEETKLEFPTYKDCYMVDEWHNYQTFCKWLDENYKEGYAIDKDILIKGNKVYGPDTCVFVPRDINSLFVKRDNCRGEYPVGVNLHKLNGKFLSHCKIKGKVRHLGYFNTPYEAFREYKIQKEKEIKRVAELWKDKIDVKVYKALLNYKVEITD